MWAPVEHMPPACAADSDHNCALAICIGKQIAEHVLSSDWFRTCKTVGVYIHCAKLREVDTSTVLDAALQQGEGNAHLEYKLVWAITSRALVLLTMR